MNNSLAEVPPELITEWSEKNLPLTPDDITFGSHTMQRFITDERTGIRYELIGDYYYPCLTVEESEIELKEVKWLWYPYIPFGKVTLLQGDPGDGKSKLMLSIAALLSNGGPLPFTDEEETEPMTIIYQTTEDDADDTIVPRFNSAGGNGENLIFIKEDEKSLSFGDNRIAEAIEKYHASSPAIRTQADGYPGIPIIGR